MAVEASRSAAAGRRDFKGMERLQLRAVRMFEQGARRPSKSLRR
jgi:hypothetical protein